MAKRDKQKKPIDSAKAASQWVDLSTGLSNLLPSLTVSEYMSKIGRKGGKIGGKRRLETMTSQQRKKIATKAAKARWKKLN
jgi:hypothetical protein